MNLKHLIEIHDLMKEIDEKFTGATIYFTEKKGNKIRAFFHIPVEFQNKEFSLNLNNELDIVTREPEVIKYYDAFGDLDHQEISDVFTMQIIITI